VCFHKTFGCANQNIQFNAKNDSFKICGENNEKDTTAETIYQVLATTME